MNTLYSAHDSSMDTLYSAHDSSMNTLYLAHDSSMNTLGKGRPRDERYQNFDVDAISIYKASIYQYITIFKSL